MISLVICLIIIIILLVHFDVRGRIKARALLEKCKKDKRRIRQAHARAHALQNALAAKWSDQNTTSDQEVLRVRELDGIWSHIRYIEEVQTHNARCEHALHQIARHYKSVNPRVRHTDLEMIAQDVDIQGWAVDGLCGGTTTQWH